MTGTAWQATGRSRVTLFVLGMMAYLLAATLNAQSAKPVLDFANPAQKALYEQLVLEYRCLKCQNQNLADSPAGLASDLRRVVHRQVVADKSRAEIDEYLVSRYGDFVLYRPRFQASTWLLWIGPFVLLALALFYGYRISIGSRRASAEKPSPDALAEARRLLQNSTER